MLEQGLVDEVRGLREKYRLAPGLPSMRCVGYRQVWDHLDGDIDASHLMRDTGIYATRQLAKRQITWLQSGWAWSKEHLEDQTDEQQLHTAARSRNQQLSLGTDLQAQRQCGKRQDQQRGDSARSNGESTITFIAARFVQLAVVEGKAALRDPLDLPHVVTDPEQRRLPLQPVIGKQRFDPPRVLLIEIAGRLVEQENCRRLHQRAQQYQPLPLAGRAAGDLPGHRRSRQVEPRQPVAGDPVVEMIAHELRPPLALGRHQRHRDVAMPVPAVAEQLVPSQ
jgi:hypothetical protein